MEHTSGHTILDNPVFLVLRWLLVAGSVFYAYRKKSLTTWIMTSMVIGVVVGYDFHDFSLNLKIISQVFLKLVKSIIAPLLFGTLVTGIAGHSNLKQVGRMGWKSIVYFEIVTTLALVIGLAAINLSRAGVGITLPAGTHEELPVVKSQTWQEIVLHVFPDNIAQATAEGQVLQIVVFSILFGIGLSLVHGRLKVVMLEFLESLSQVMFKFTSVVMFFAPIAVGAALAYTVAHMGLGILVNLLQLLLTLYGALLAFIILVLVPAGLLTGLPFRRFWAEIGDSVALAFATTSSEAALPKAMEALERLGVPRKVVAFVMPTGYSFNLAGTTLYLVLAAVFVAQAAGIELTLEKQLVMVFTLMLTSKGVAGVPRASLIILLGTAATFGLPTWPIFIILGIDELMDMARTSVNVIGNCLASWVVAKWEGELDPNKVNTQEPALAE